MRPPMLSRLGRFVTVGAAATLAYAAFALVFTRGLHIPPSLAAIGAYLLAAALSYFGHRRITFRSGRPHAVAGSQFLALTAIGMSVAAGFAGFAQRYGLPVEAALLTTCVAIPALNYLALDRIVFREPTPALVRKRRDGA